MKKNVSLVLLAMLLGGAAPARADWVNTTVPVGTNPYGVAINPVTNKIYVANQNTDDVTVIDGATNITATVAAGDWPYFVAINPVTNKIYVTNRNSSTVTVIDGATNDTCSVVVGTDPQGLAVNPVTNKIYVANNGSNSVTVIDGTDNTIDTTVAAGTGPCLVAVNPVTNVIYVTNWTSNDVTVINGATNGTTAVIAGTAPYALAVNSVTNKVYVANNASNNVTVINGTDNSTIAIGAGSNPRGVAVNPATNMIYVVNSVSANVTVINGATNTVIATVAVGSDASIFVAVNPAANKIYVANYSNNSVTVIDGATNTKTTVAVGTNPWGVAVNPVTNKIYAANYGSANVTVIDGCSNKPVNVAAGTGPVFAAVNPVTDKIYVVNHGSNNVTVVDGVTNAAVNVAVGAFPQTLTVNPVTNKIYVTNYNSRNVTVIDGLDNSTATVEADSAPCGVGHNPVTNKIYVANNGSNSVTVIDGTDNSTVTVAVGTNPWGVAVNPVTNKIYVANGGSANITVIDGATNSTTTVAAGTTPSGIAVNPVTNRIYVANYGSNNVTVINGATNTVIATVASGSGPYSVAVNSITDKIYVPNFWSANLTVINGVTNAASTVATGDRPHGVAVNPVTNKIYVPNWGIPYTVSIIDGATNSRTDVAAATQPCGIAVNPVTNKVYETGYHTNLITVITEALVYDTGVRVVIDSLPDNAAYQAQPVLTGKGVNRWSPSKTNMMGVINDFPDIQHVWNWAAGPFDSTSSDSIGWTYNWGTDSLLYGENYINIVPLEMQAATTNNLGLGTPMAGNMLTYPVYYLDNVPPSKVVLVSPNDGWLTTDSSLVLEFTWNQATDNYGMGEYRLQYASDRAFTQDLFDTTLSDTTLSRKVTILSTAVYWRVRAIDVAGNEGEYSTARQFEIDPTAPEAPVLVAPSDGVFINDTAVVFSWSSVAKVAKSAVRYILQADTTATFAGSVIADTTDMLEDTLNLSPGIYWWRVMAFDLAGNQGVFSEVRSFEIDTLSPLAPTLLSPANNSWLASDTALCTWSAVSKMTKASAVYYVCKAFQMPDTANPVIVDTTVLTADTLLISEGRYIWQVEAYDEAGNPPGISEYYNFGYDTTSPAVASLLTPADSLTTNQSSTNFVWNISSDAVSGLKEYTLQYAYDQSFIVGLAETTLTDTSITLVMADSNYYWRVVASDTAGNLSMSIVRYLSIDTYDPAIPTLLSPIDGYWTEDSTIICSWGEVVKTAKAAEVSYVIQLDTISTFTTPLIEDTTAILLDTFNLSEGQYFWRVMAFDLAGNYGTYSEYKTFGIDTTAPDIQYVSSLLDDPSAPYGPYEVTSSVYDLSGVKTAYMFTQINGGAWDSTAMFFASDSLRDSIPEQTVATDETLSVSYYIKTIDMLDHQSISSTYSFKAIGPSGVAGEPTTSLPKTYALENAYPNPSRGQTVFKYQLPKESKVSLTVYNVVGQMIKRFDIGAKPAGYHQISWNENTLPNGVYIYQLKARLCQGSGGQAGEFSATKKLTVIR